MLGIMVESREKAFMIMNRFICFLIVSTSFTLVNCEQTVDDIPIPFVDFQDIVINLSLPEYQALDIDKGSVLLNDGVRGIILYRESSTSYIAFERNCSFEPNSACATVKVHQSTFFMTDDCCGSNFSFQDGLPTSGPARSPLRIYETRLSGNTLTITDQSANGF